jgi:hypothetical protein
MDTASFLVRGLNLQLPEKLAQYIEPVDTTCCITGERITRGIPHKRVIPASTGEYLDLLHGMTFTHVGVEAATAFKGSWNLGSRLIFEDGTAYHPYIASASADKSERTYWSALVRDVWPERRGQRCLCIVAGDFKKRVWHLATVGELGRNTPILVLDPDRFVLQNLSADWERLISVLDFVEVAYSAGFSKDAIANSLYSHYAALSENPTRTMDWERQLADIRSLPEFTVAILIAQKDEK